MSLYTDILHMSGTVPPGDLRKSAAAASLTSLFESSLDVADAFDATAAESYRLAQDVATLVGFGIRQGRFGVVEGRFSVGFGQVWGWGWFGVSLGIV